MRKAVVNEMKKFFLFCALAALGLFCAGASSAQTPQAPTSQGGDAPRPQRARVVGEVTAVDASAGRVPVKKDAGATGTISTDGKTTYLRLPPPRANLHQTPPPQSPGSPAGGPPPA